MEPHTIVGLHDQYLVQGNAKVSFTQNLDTEIFNAIDKITLENPAGEKWRCSHISFVDVSVFNGIMTWDVNFRICDRTPATPRPGHLPKSKLKVFYNKQSGGFQHGEVLYAASDTFLKSLQEAQVAINAMEQKFSLYAGE
jgi:hypothetical protein